MLFFFACTFRIAPWNPGRQQQHALLRWLPKVACWSPRFASGEIIAKSGRGFEILCENNDHRLVMWSFFDVFFSFLFTVGFLRGREEKGRKICAKGMMLVMMNIDKNVFWADPGVVFGYGVESYSWMLLFWLLWVYEKISRFGVVQFSGFGCILFIGFLTEGMWKFGFLRHSPVDLKYLI